MRESWIDADDKTIRDDIVSIAKEKTGLTNFKSTGVLRGIIEALAACVIFIYKTAINPIYRNATLDGAAGLFLTLWGLLLGWRGNRTTRRRETLPGIPTARARSLPARGSWWKERNSVTG